MSRSGLALLVLLIGGVIVRAQTPAEIVDRAIKAHGGSDVLIKMKAVEQTAKGKCSIGGPDLDAVRESKWALPDRVLWSLDMSRDATKLKMIIGLNGLSGWQKFNTNAAVDLPPSQYDLIAQEAWVWSLCTVGPLTQKGLTIGPAPPVQIDGQPVDGIRVTREGRPDVTLYFAKSSGRLVRAVARIKDAGAIANKEWNFADHKEFGGVRLPTKITEMQDGKRQAEWTSVEYKFVDKFDPAVFRKP